MTAALTIQPRGQPDTSTSVQSLAQMAVLSCQSPATRRNYAREIARFLSSGRTLTREDVQSHLLHLRDSGAGPQTVSVARAAVLKLAREAYMRGLLTDQEYGAVKGIDGVRTKGQACGKWLSLAEVRLVLQAAGQRGARDEALIAVLLGCGLRRADVCELTWDQWQKREGRWCFVDVIGKGGRKRTVPAPGWVADRVNRWKETGSE